MSAMSMTGVAMASIPWQRGPGETWLGALASFLAMWMPMMGAMMLPSAVPMLWQFRRATAASGSALPGGLAVLAGVAYFVVWAGLGAVVFPAGAALAAIEMRVPELVRAVSIAAGVVVLVGGAFQFTPWKAHLLRCCRRAPGIVRTVPADTVTAWRDGLRLGIDCVRCSAGLVAALFAVGASDLRATVAVTIAITAERLVPARLRAAQAIGVAVCGTGLLLLAQQIHFA